MKKIILVCLLLLSVVSLSRADDQPKQLTDAQIRLGIVGGWTREGELLGAKITERWVFSTNGAFVKQTASARNGETHASVGYGLWGVKDGQLTTSISRIEPAPTSGVAKTIADGLAKRPMVSKRKIINVTPQALTVESDLMREPGTYGSTTKPITFTRDSTPK